jgi:hypothetical protein
MVSSSRLVIFLNGAGFIDKSAMNSGTYQEAIRQSTQASE